MTDLQDQQFMQMLKEWQYKARQVTVEQTASPVPLVTQEI